MDFGAGFEAEGPSDLDGGGLVVPFGFASVEGEGVDGVVPDFGRGFGFGAPFPA